MTPAVENRLIWSGCLVALIGTALLIYVATKLDWYYGVAGVLLVPIWGLVARRRGKVEERVNLKALQEIVRSKGCPSPTLRRAGGYGYPGFVLVFRSKADLGAAESAGCIAAFKAFLQNRYADFGSKANPFDVERAVSVTHESTSEA